MSSAAYFRTLAAYNRWANRRLYKACAEISDDDYYDDTGAFFGSIHHTLNHILVGDRLWMGRLQNVDAHIDTLDQVLYTTFSDLFAARRAEDERIVAHMATVSDGDLRGHLVYQSMAGADQETRLDLVLGHFFNHQTHHRGQVHDMLSRAGEDPPPLDLIYFSRDPSFTSS